MHTAAHSAQLGPPRCMHPQETRFPRSGDAYQELGEAANEGLLLRFAARHQHTIRLRPPAHVRKLGTLIA